MISYSELHRGSELEFDDEAYRVLEWKHVKMQKQAPTLTLKLRHMRTGKVIEKKVSGNQRLALASVEHKEAQCLYKEGNQYVFMDTETYEQFPLGLEQLGASVAYLKEGNSLKLGFYKGQAISIDVGNFVDLQVADTPPGYKGDTAQGAKKLATLETGVSIKVPLHVNTGDKIKVDTRTGDYVETVT